MIIPAVDQGEILVVVELQTEDTTAIDWPPGAPVEEPSPTLRLLARVPRMDDRLRLSMRVSPDEVLLVDRQPVGESSLEVDGNMSARGSDWISRLCELHATVLPYAGLIVTFALFVSAGLLYWLVFGPFSNANHPQEPMGMDRIGQYSSEPNAGTTNGPVWSVPDSQPVGTEAKPVVSKEKTAQSVPWQHDPNRDTVAVDVQQAYPETRYRSYDFISSEASEQDRRPRHEIASRPDRNSTRQQIR